MVTESEQLDQFHENLIGPNGKASLDYLTQKRGFNLEMIEQFNLGANGKGDISIALPDPVNPEAIKFRLLNPVGKLKCINPKDYKSTIFNKLTLNRENLLKLVVCEGEFDVITLEQYDIPAITKSTGVHTKYTDKELKAILKINPDLVIYFGFDNDKAGLTEMVAYACDYYFEPRIRLCQLNDQKDWNEKLQFFKSQGMSEDEIKKAFEDILAKSMSAKDFYIAFGKKFGKGLLNFVNLEQVQSVPMEYLVDPYIVKNGINLIVAPAGSFKSYLSLDIAISCLKGIDFLGVIPTKPIKFILLIDQENIVHMVKERIKSLGGEESNFLFLDEFLFFDVDFEIKDKLIKTLKLYPDSILIIDTLRRVNRNMDENSSNDMSKFFGTLNELKKYSTIIVLHHTRKNNEDNGKAPMYRGSSDVIGAVDSAITLVKIDEAKDKIELEITQTKARYTSAEDPLIAEYQFVGEKLNRTGRFKSSIQRGFSEISKKEILLAFIVEGAYEGRTNQEIEAFGKVNLNIGEHQAKELRDDLLRLEKILCIKCFRGKKDAFFATSFAPQQPKPLGIELLSSKIS